MPPISFNQTSVSSLHILRITLADIEPPLWRTVAVPSDLTLAEVHEILQIVFGWYNGQVYQFVLADKAAKHGIGFASDPVFDLGEGKNAHDLRLSKVCVKEKSTLKYEYDMEDGWAHDIEVLAIEKPKAGVIYPLVLDGERNGPMEDCGGAAGHMELVQALENPEEADPAMLEWAEEYQPEKFDKTEINAVLRDWAIEHERLLADGIGWRRSSLLWDLGNFPKQHLGPRLAHPQAEVAGKLEKKK